jgi:hypothetical protein
MCELVWTASAARWTKNEHDPAVNGDAAAAKKWALQV